ncbi:MAG: hypothetical protein RR946_01655 [Clostridia bacterium]
MTKAPKEQAPAVEQAAYLTLLPPMDEGFHTGYQPQAGIIGEQNQKPREWLIHFAKHMQSQGEEVSFSIPDVLASEQQLRRLACLPHDLALHHQEMINYRAMLALMLLWDGWPQDAAWPTLSLIHASADATAFTRSVRAALTPERAKDGLWVYTLTPSQAEPTKVYPLCMLSRAMVLMPSANLGDLSALLPAQVRWYDRKHKRFLDPCGFLDERDTSRLVLQLRLLVALNERAELGSPLYSADAQLCGLLNHFADDLLRHRNAWRQRLDSGDEAAALELRTRILAVYGLRTFSGYENHVTEQVLHTEVAELAQNPLLRAFLPQGAPPASTLADSDCTLYLLDGIPFARLSSAYLLEPAYAQGESDALRRAAEEMAVPDRFYAPWNQSMAALLRSLQSKLQNRVGMSVQVLSLLGTWAEQYEGYAALSDRNLPLHYPMQEECPPALLELLTDMLGPISTEVLKAPFSDCLLLIEAAQQSPFDDEVLSKSCCLGEGRYAVPPLSPQLCAWLQTQSEASAAAAQLDPASLRFTYHPAQNQITASFNLLGRAREAGAVLTDTVTFTRTYALREAPEVGSILSLPAAALPYVAVWPNVRLAQGQWKQYFVYTHRPEALDLWALADAGWVRGTAHNAVDGNGSRAWQTACVERFPLYVALKRGELSMGALCNPCPRTLLKREPAAVVSVDFGSIATTVMLAQAERQRPAALPSCLHHALLCTQPEDERFLADELLPKSALFSPQDGRESTFYSVMELFSDDPARWQSVLQDGHIYYRESMAALLCKNENSLYYDLKWGEEDYLLRVLRLFLKQVLIQASLCARLLGSSEVSWRISMPTALAPHKREAYLELMRGLSREVAQETGLPLTSACPAVLFATENQADGLYFLSRNEVDAHSGYLNMDIGGGTADISLWLNGAAHATAECSLMLGCRQMLFDSLEQTDGSAFAQDFSHAPNEVKSAVHAILQALNQSASGTRGRQKAMLLLDDFFAVHAQAICQAMAETRAQGRISHLEGLLLFNIGFLFFLCGMLLERAFEQSELQTLLPKRIALCIAGNGGQLVKILSDEQREKLCLLALSCLSPAHPLAALLPVQSRHPKQEVAIGLLSEATQLQSTLRHSDCWNGTPEEADEASKTDFVRAYLPKFYEAFPQAANRLLPSVFEESGPHGGIRLCATASMELETIFQNERCKAPEDDFLTAVSCFTAMKRLWSV